MSKMDTQLCPQDQQQAQTQDIKSKCTVESSNNSEDEQFGGKSREPRLISALRDAASCALLLFLVIVTTTLSQISLAPVLGSLPIEDRHEHQTAIAFFLGSLQHHTFPGMKAVPLRFVIMWKAFCPTIMDLYTAHIGPVPGLQRCFFEHYIVIITAGYVWTGYMYEGSIPRYLRSKVFRSKWTPKVFYVVSATAATFILMGSQGWVREYLLTATQRKALKGNSRQLNPVVGQMGVALMCDYLIGHIDEDMTPSLWGALALAFIWYLNPHASISNVNSALQPHNWTLLDRAWSNTGYLSVLESTTSHYRVFRADHSLLGGEWLATPERRQNDNWKVNEPIYAVFEMLEAVRLMQVEAADSSSGILDETTIPDTSVQQALVIGLGIGTAPKAFVEHGIDTTVVEIDPVVHKFATQYFALPANHTAILQDAIVWVNEQGTSLSPPTHTSKAKRYNWIIHDVFTGGAEPLALFTTSFLSNLKTLLSPHGSIAINYAGDLSLPLTRLVLRTIHHIFDGQCKIFRDAPPSTPVKDAKNANIKKNENANAKRKKNDVDGGDADEAQDFLNVVVFCRNSPGPISFREPVEEDFLGSISRRHYLLPKPELEMPFPELDASDDGPSLLEAGGEGAWYEQQVESAKRHRRLMRTVLPDAVWENW